MEDLKVLLQNAKASAIPNDGTLEVAMSIASVSSQVTVTVNPFAVRPPDLFLKTLAAVGVALSAMPSFKSNLQHLLPKIASSIALIPEDPTADIGDVAELVRLWLLSV